MANTIGEPKSPLHEFLNFLPSIASIFEKKYEMKKPILTILTIVLQLISMAQVENGLIADYHFSYTGRFDFKNGNNATILGATPTTDRFGRANMAYEFDGIDDYMNVDHNSLQDLDLMTGISISVWVNPTVLPTTGLAAIVTKWHGFTNEQFGIFMDGGNNMVGIRQVNSNGISDNANMTTNTWYHVVFTFDKTTGEHKVFVNNINTLTQTITNPYNNTTATTSLSFGAQANVMNGGPASPTRFFNGKIDDIRIYNRVLNTNEIDSLYHLDEPVCLGFEADVTSTMDASSSVASDGSFSFITTGGFAPYSYTINGGSAININSGSMCGGSFEGGGFTLVPPTPSIITSLSFVSYGNPNGTCSNFTYGTCHAISSYSANQSAIGQTSAYLDASNVTYGDPCFGNGKYLSAQLSYAEEVTISNLAPGTYTLELTDSLGCTTMKEVVIGSPMNITELSSNLSKVYPNPATDILNIQAFTSTQISILNIVGVEILNFEMDKNINLNISSLKKGVYFVRDLNTLQTIRFVKN